MMLLEKAKSILQEKGGVQIDGRVKALIQPNHLTMPNIRENLHKENFGTMRQKTQENTSDPTSVLKRRFSELQLNVSAPWI